MNQKTFLNSVSNGKKDVIQEVLSLLKDNHIEYCIIGGLAVNAFVEPVVSLDLDIVVTVDAIEKLIELIRENNIAEINIFLNQKLGDGWEKTYEKLGENR